MAVDFKGMLSKPVDSAERPKPLPAGTYFGHVGKFEFLESKEKKTPYVRFHLKLTAPGDDVSPDALMMTDSKGHQSVVDVTKKPLRKDFYITEDALFRLREFIESCGISSEGRSFNETIPELMNAPVLISVTQRPGQNPEDIFNDVDKIVGQS